MLPLHSANKIPPTSQAEQQLHRANVITCSKDVGYERMSALPTDPASIGRLITPSPRLSQEVQTGSPLYPHKRITVNLTPSVVCASVVDRDNRLFGGFEEHGGTRVVSMTVPA